MAYLRLIIDKPRDGSFHMAIDEKLFKKAIQSRESNPILRFYRFAVPTLTVGYGTWRSCTIQPNRSIPVVRRMTGGGIVCHEGDLIYSLIIPILTFKSFGKVRESYRLIHSALQKTLKQFNIETELF